MPIFGLKKRQFSQHYTILWVKIVIRMPLFFSDFSRKNHYSHVHILSKKRPFFKKHSALMPIHYQKNVNSLKNTMLSCHFKKKNPKILKTTIILVVQNQCFPLIILLKLFSFDYPSKTKKNLIVQSVQNSVYPQTPCCAFRYATISPQCYALCGPLIK